MKTARLFSFALLLMLLLPSPIQAQRKAVSILGDSYSTFEGYITPDTNEPWYIRKIRRDNTDVSDVTQTWWWQYIKRNGYKLCVNNSYSGATISYTGYSGNDYSKRSFVTRMYNLGCPDMIFIFGGTNDSWAGSPVGEYQYDSLRVGQLYEFRPAMAYMLQEMTRLYPNVDIIFLINDGLKESIVSSIKTICDHYDVRYIELKDIDKMSGHPSQKGMMQICTQIEEALNPAKK